MADWHQACSRKRPLRARRAPTNRPIPMAISTARTKSAARGAAVSKNASLNRLSPCRLPTASHSCFGENLAWHSGQSLFWQLRGRCQGRTSVVAHDPLPWPSGVTTLKATNAIGAPCLDITPQLPFIRVSRRGASANHRACIEFSKGFASL